MMKNIFFLPVVPSLASLAAALNWDPVRHGKIVYILTYIYIRMSLGDNSASAMQSELKHPLFLLLLIL